MMATLSVAFVVLTALDWLGFKATLLGLAIVGLAGSIISTAVNFLP